MLLKDKVAVITGGAGLNGLGFATAKLMAATRRARGRARPGARRARRRRRQAGRRPPRRGGRRHRQGVVRRRDRRGAQGLRPHRRAGQQRRHHAAAQDAWTSPTPTTTRILDVSLRGTLLMSQAVMPADAAPAERLDRLHLVGVGAARRRHPRRPALLGGQGRRARPGPRDGARVRHRLDPRQLHHPRADPDRHPEGQAQRRAQGRDRQRRSRSAASAWPTTSPAPACILASDLSSYCTGITLDVNGGMLIH